MSFDSLVGQTLGQYELRALLGAGGMGAVYRGFQAGLRREVAVKVLPSILAQDSNYIARFNREAEISAALENAHIVPVYDYGTQNGISYVVMRLLSGGSLADRLRIAEEQKLPLPSLTEISSMLKQLAGALDYAHNRGVIHRDLKPGNIMFDNQGDAFLVDFGIAKLLKATTSLTGTGMGVGTPSFMPPEQWRSEELTPAADQYALAIVIYMMLTGHMPFEADTPFQAMHKHLNEPPTPAQVYRADVPQSVSLVLERALSKEPAARFPTVTAFAQAFDSAISGFASTTTGFFTSPVLPRTPTARPTVAHTPVAPRMATAPITGGTGGGATITGNQPSAPPRRGPMIVIGAVVALILIAAIGFAVLQTMNSHTSEQNFNATLTGIALAAVPTSTPTTAPTSTTAATEAIVSVPTSSATPTLTNTEAPSATPTKTLPPTLSNAQISATAALTVSEEAKLTQVAAVDITARALMMANQTAAAQIQQTQTALAASPTPSATPTATSTPTTTVTPSPTLTPTFTQTSAASATPTVTHTVAPTQTAHPTETPMVTSTPRQIALATEIPTLAATPRGIRLATATPQTDANIVVTQGDSVVIGLAASLGGSTADYGTDARRAVELALKDRPNVIVDGKTFPVTLDVRDDQCNSSGGQFIANTFVANARVAGVIGPTCTSGCQAAAPIFDAAHFTSISPSCTTSDLTASGFTSFNRTVSPDSAQGKVAAEYIYHTLGITRIATVADASLYSVGLVDAVTKAFVALGGRVVAASSADVSTANFRRTMQTLTARDPQLIYFGGSAYQVETWAQRDDVAPTVPLMAFDRLDYAQATTLSSKGTQGMYVLAAMQPSNAETTRFLQHYRSAYGEEPPAPYHEEAYDAVNILLDAITYTGSVDATGTLVIDRAKLAAYVRSVKDTTGLTGTLTANGKGELATSPIGIFQESGGTLTQVAVGEIDVATGAVTVGEPG